MNRTEIQLLIAGKNNSLLNKGKTNTWCIMEFCIKLNSLKENYKVLFNPTHEIHLPGHSWDKCCKVGNSKRSKWSCLPLKCFQYDFKKPASWLTINCNSKGFPRYSMFASIAASTCNAKVVQNYHLLMGSNYICYKSVCKQKLQMESRRERRVFILPLM